MALVTNYTTLQSHVTDTLNRSDLAGVVPNFIQQFEAQANRGSRAADGVVIPVRILVAISPFNISQDNLQLPTDLVELDSWYHDGPTYYGPIINVGSGNELGRLNGTSQGTGVPEFFSIAGGRARFSPPPNATFATKLTYWAGVLALSANNPTNWLLTSHPDIYIYGTLLEAAPYLKNDVRIPVWEKLLLDRVEALHQASIAKLMGGAVQRQFEPIGG